MKALLEEMVAADVVSAAVGRIESRGRVVTAAAGEAAGPDAWFDLGSLTKPFAATLALVLDAAGTLPLDAAVGEVFPDAHPDLAPVPLGDLLRHRAGFRPWYPLSAACGEVEEIRDLLLSGKLLGAAPGTYSDLDVLLWGLAAEAVLGDSLAALWRRLVFSSLGLETVAASPGRLPKMTPCRLDNGREVELARELGFEVPPVASPPDGIVQDGNARFLGGLTAHAGLFAGAGDVATLAREWLRPGRLLHPEVVARALAGEGPYVVGWQRWDDRGGSAPLGPRSFGHWGFPGGSVWVDPDRGAVYVLLAHKGSSKVDLTPWRRRFHALPVA